MEFMAEVDCLPVGDLVIGRQSLAKTGCHPVGQFVRQCWDRGLEVEGGREGRFSKALTCPALRPGADERIARRKHLVGRSPCLPSAAPNRSQPRERPTRRGCSIVVKLLLEPDAYANGTSRG